MKFFITKKLHGKKKNNNEEKNGNNYETMIFNKIFFGFAVTQKGLILKFKTFPKHLSGNI